MKFQVNPQNPVKFTKMCKIQRNSREILSNTCRYNIFETYLGYWGCLIAENLQIYLETLSPQCTNNVLKLPGVNYVAKNWAIIMMLKALPLAHFLSALLLEYVRLSLLKTLNTLSNWRKINRFLAKLAQKIPTKSAVFSDWFSVMLAAKISAKSVSENPVKFYFRDLSEAL